MNRILGMMALTLSLSFTAHAQTAGGKLPPLPKPGACLADIDKFCSKVRPKGGRTHSCLGKNIEKLTPACKASWEMKQKRMDAVYGARAQAAASAEKKAPAAKPQAAQPTKAKGQ